MLWAFIDFIFINFGFVMNEHCLKNAVRKRIIDFKQNETRDKVQVFPFQGFD